MNILGTEYTILCKTGDSARSDIRLRNNDAYTDYTTKEIVIGEFEDDIDNLEDLEMLRRKLIRHEITHAFFYESGLSCNSEYAENEELVDWIAIQSPKLFKAFAECSALE